MRHSCRVCGSADLLEIFAHPKTPLFVGIVGENTPDELVNATLPISLVACSICKTIQQSVEPEIDELLDQIYLNSQDNAVSGTRTGEGEFGIQRAHLFIEKAGLDAMPARILEIGCNEGHMLAFCKELGGQQLVGVEEILRLLLMPSSATLSIPLGLW